MRRRIWVGALVLLLDVSAAAQDTPLIARSGSRPLLRPEGTYVFQHAPNSDLVFEAQIAPRIIILDSIGKALTQTLKEGKAPVWGYQVSTTPMVRLRMFNEKSNPVRTPSYMPKGTVQVARFKNRSPASDVNSHEFNAGPVEMWLVDVIPFGHHSNGQNGCLFTSERRDAAGECFDSAPTAPKRVNKENGSFSTNYVEATVQYGRMHLDSEGAGAADFATRWEWRLGAGLQLNPGGYAGGSITPELSKRYGPTRVIVEALTARRDLWRCGRVSGDVRLQLMTDPPRGLSPVIARMEGVCFPRKWGGAGLFVTVYRGQDYYNLGFADSITRLQFGVTLQREQFLSFRID